MFRATGVRDDDGFIEGDDGGEDAKSNEGALKFECVGW